MNQVVGIGVVRVEEIRAGETKIFVDRKAYRGREGLPISMPTFRSHFRLRHGKDEKLTMADAIIDSTVPPHLLKARPGSASCPTRSHRLDLAGSADSLFMFQRSPVPQSARASILFAGSSTRGRVS